MTTILGIDPGLGKTGYAVLEADSQQLKLVEGGIIRPGSGVQDHELAPRLLQLHQSLMEILQQYSPSVLVVEQLYSHYDHPRTAIIMGHARGAILLAGAQHGLNVVSYAATQIKKVLTGNGRASKDQVQYAIMREFSLPAPPEPPDVADAIAIALCHAHLGGWGNGIRNAQISGVNLRELGLLPPEPHSSTEGAA
ncbi:MAG: crossover junction endodeoxyribonuclease RuvC [Zavarzinella sp.]